MKILKGILYLLEMIPIAAFIALFGITILSVVSGDDAMWFLEPYSVGLYTYLALSFLLAAFGFRKKWFRSVFVRLFFTWLAFLLAVSWCVIIGPNLEGGTESYTLWGWLRESPGSWAMYAYLLSSFLLFHYGFRFAARFRWKWRVLVSFSPCILFCVFFWLICWSIPHYYQSRHYEHQSAVEDNPMGERLQAQMSSIISCITNSAYPAADKFESRTAQEALFDPNYYFTVFTNLHLEAGYELDYRFERDWFESSPWVYARRIGGAFIADGGDTEWYLKVHLNGSPESYLEYVVLYLFADQFYLSGHAFQYSEGRVVSSKASFEELLNGKLRLGPNSAKEACTLGFFPKVSIGQDAVEISIATFSLWGGLEKKTVVVEKEFPHRVLEDEMDWETLIDYDCGILF